jgi:DNA-binding protein H-NS
LAIANSPTILFNSIDEETTMARTLAQIKSHIARLEKEAEAVRAKEVAGVIQRIKTAIEFYGLTADDLFGPTRKTVAADGRKVASKKNKRAKKPPAPAKYRDNATGKTWTGHGKRPAWFVQAIESGMKAEEMAV